MRIKTKVPVLAMLVLVFAAGCDAIPPEFEKNWIQLQKEWDALTTVLTGGRSPLAKNATLPSPSPGPSVAAQPESDLSPQNIRNVKANAELLQEVYRVVFMREPKDRGEFGNMLDSMNQGASVEGIYNGYTHSSDYRKLEMVNAGATPEALQAFGQELALLESELPVPAAFDAASTRPLAMPVQPGVEPGTPENMANGVTVIEYGKPAQPGVPVPSPAVSGAPQVDVKVLSDKYTQQFVGASIFTLKRILADEAMRVMSVKKEYPEKLALWYSQWVVHMVGRNVDFGVSLRNKPDEAFHYQWALKASEDRLRWEVLNRLHRVLNDANRTKQ